MVVTTERKTQEERREEILDAALIEFAERGLHGASTEDIAKRAGSRSRMSSGSSGRRRSSHGVGVARCFRETLELFQRAAEGKRGEEALDAMGAAYVELLRPTAPGCARRCRPTRPATTPTSAQVVRDGFGDLVAYVERVSGLPAGGGLAASSRRDAAERPRLDGRARRPEPWVERAARRLQGKD